MEWLTMTNLVGAGLVLIGVCSVINLVGDTIDRLRKWRKPQEDIMTRMNDMAKKLDTDKRRLDDHETRLGDMRNGLMAVCEGVQALLGHELHNGNSGAMEEASDKIDGWLRGR